ncbi:uncharacterized protein A4U43_C01F17640 [Asparagus officinalis]|uniref:CRC domain-containing protein n=1 Tax=Asparagus officinalis TaxID=4686 RepID=A0A5P1FUT9_ASPOF|nr:uncharacterized protein A4U43_C01F17640 [Asparagus officinalis]
MDRGVQSASSPLSRQLDFAPSVSSSRSSISTPLKSESPRSWTIPTFETKIVTPKKAKQCNCKNSQCLKKYCECFTTNTYCKGCNCVNCHNVENDPARKDAIEAVLDRNPNAFRPKIDGSPQAARDKENAGEPPLLVRHHKGCNCKKSGCLKKYCECFQAGILCSENCKCLDCKNFEGSEDRKLLFSVDRGNSLTYIQKTANAAISGATGSSGFFSLENRKRKSHHLLLGAAINSQPFHGNGQASQANHLTGAQLSSSFTGIPVAHVIIPSPQSKLTYRYKSIFK